MYSGLVFTKYSGRLMGAHQKIDRVARRHLGELLPEITDFPSIKEILQFEGKNGPDGIKRKSPSHNEPWHFLDPLGDKHDDFLEMINKHHQTLVSSLKKGNRERSAFEAAWLAHTVVDGLTPAHHFPYDEKVAELRAEGGNESRDTISKKLIFHGDTVSQTIFNNFRVYGPKGLLSSHILFEFGVMFLIRPLRLPDARPSAADLEELLEVGVNEFFMRRAREVAVMGLFEKYMKTGWTPKLSNQVRHKLLPVMVKTVTVLWYAAVMDAKT